MALIAGMCVIGFGALGIPAWLVEYRVGRPISDPAVASTAEAPEP